MIPAIDIAETILQPDTIQSMDDAIAAHKSAGEEQPAGILRKPPKETPAAEPEAENPDHLEDFTSLLSAAVKPPKSGE